MRPVPRSRFLVLPRELRDIIYHHYISEDAGYTYEPASCRLVPESGSNNLALMYTCRLVAAKMREVPRYTINFYSWYSDSARIKACLFDSFLRTLTDVKCDAIDWGRACVTEEATSTITNRYPKFRPLFERLKANQRDFDLYCITGCAMGDAPSIHRDFVDYAWKILSVAPNFASQVADTPSRHPWENSFDTAPMTSLRSTSRFVAYLHENVRIGLLWILPHYITGHPLRSLSDMAAKCVRKNKRKEDRGAALHFALGNRKFACFLFSPRRMCYFCYVSTQFK
jgi:hypothetical protein